MNATLSVFRREFAGYFRTPVAYVFLVVFLVSSMLLAFFVGDLFKARIANLERFFLFLPWLFLFLIPAACMRLWAEERRTGSIELLFTLPVTTTAAVVGKFLAAWAFVGIGLALTATLPFTLAFLGRPDWGLVASGYLGAFLMAAAYIGISSLMSALTRNQVIAFVLSVLACFLLVLLGWSLFDGFMRNALGLPPGIVEAVANFSFLTHFDAMTRGIVDLRAVTFFGALTTGTLAVNVIVLER